MSQLSINPALQLAFRGKIIQKDTPEYKNFDKCHNNAFTCRSEIIFDCLGASDVSRAILFAKENKLGVNVRCGGHGADGSSAGEPGNVLIYLGRMRSVHVDESQRLARVDGGARLVDINAEVGSVTKDRFAVPVGVAGPTGIGGLALHGGIGFLQNRYGLTADNIVGAQVVLADGSIVETDTSRHPELFWAIRGSAANFGVVTRIDFRIQPIGALVGGLWAIVAEKPEQRTEAIRLMRDMRDKHVGNVFGSAFLVSGPPGHPAAGKPMAVFFVGSWLNAGDSEEDAQKRLEPLVEFTQRNGGYALGGAPQRLSWLDFNNLLAPLVQGFPPEVRGYWRGLFLKHKDVTDDYINTMVDEWTKRPAPGQPMSLLILDFHGGPVGEAVGRAASLTHLPDGSTQDIPCGQIRDFDIGIGLLSYYMGQENDETIKEFARTIHDRLHKLAPSKYYVNYDTESSSTDSKLLSTLRQIKKQYDPNNVFSRKNLKI